MPKMSQFSVVTSPSTADKFVLVRGSGGQAEDVLISYADLITQLGLEVIPLERNYVVTFADSPFTVPDAVCTVFVDTTGGVVEIDLKTAALGNKLSIIRTNAGANNANLNYTNINGAATYSLTSQYDRAVIKSDSTTYYVLSE